MPKFPRKTAPLFGDDGRFYRTDVLLNHGCHLEFREFVGNNPGRLRMRFNNWWMTPRALDELIAELCYVKEEWELYRGEGTEPVEEEDDEPEEEEDVDNPFERRVRMVEREGMFVPVFGRDEGNLPD